MQQPMIEWKMESNLYIFNTQILLEEINENCSNLQKFFYSAPCCFFHDNPCIGRVQAIGYTLQCILYSVQVQLSQVQVVFQNFQYGNNFSPKSNTTFSAISEIMLSIFHFPILRILLLFRSKSAQQKGQDFRGQLPVSVAVK